MVLGAASDERHTVVDEQPAAGRGAADGGPARPTASRRELAGYAAVVVALAAFTAAFAWEASVPVGGTRSVVLFDDAMISMRYARNLAAGDGLVWNAGGPRVEGITNPLWTLWMAVLHLGPLGPFKVAVPVQLTSLGAVLATLWTVRRLAGEVAPGDPFTRVVAVVACAAYFPLLFWSLGGMEVGVLAWLTATLALVGVRLDRLRDRARRRAMVVFALASAGAVAVRLDAVTVVAVAVAWCVARAGAADRRRVLVVTAAPTLLCLAAMTLGRWLYYGAVLPNTYYLKSTGVPLGVRLGTGAEALGRVAVVHLALMLLAAGFALGRRRPPAVWLLAALVAVQAAYSAWVGGDAWEGLQFANRYLTVAIAPLAVLAACGLRGLVGAGRRAGAFCMAAGAALVARTIVLGRDGPVDRWVSQIERDRWWLMACGAVLVTAGFALRYRPRWATTGAVAAATVVVVGVTSVPGFDLWRRASWVTHDRGYVREGLAVAAATDPDAVVAWWNAGAGAYFAERPAVDLYGKSDVTIAHLPVVPGDFWPGHSKYDLAWSLARYEPDLVSMPSLQLGGKQAILARAGYTPTGAGTLWVRDGSDRVDVGRLRAELARLEALD